MASEPSSVYLSLGGPPIILDPSLVHKKLLFPINKQLSIDSHLGKVIVGIFAHLNQITTPHSLFKFKPKYKNVMEIRQFFPLGQRQSVLYKFKERTSLFYAHPKELLIFVLSPFSYHAFPSCISWGKKKT